MGREVESATGTVRCGFAMALTAAFLLSTNAAAAGYDRTGEASWYGKRYQGRSTASGEPFDMNGLTAAHRKLAFGTLVRVTNLANRRSVVVRINDRGPYARGRLIDLSQRAAAQLGFQRQGVARVRVEVVQEAPPAQQAQQAQVPRTRSTPSLESIRESLRIVRDAPSQANSPQPPARSGSQPMREVSPGVWVAPFSDAP